MGRLVKLIIPLFCLVFTLFCASTATPQIMPRGPVESFDKPWRVRFVYVDGSSIEYGHMDLSWKTKKECEAHKIHMLLAVYFKAFPFNVVSAWCRVDGTQT